MKARWLLLGVSVICVLVLFPAAALSQRPTVNAGCGTATIDGRLGGAEWANAGRVALYPALGLATPVNGPPLLLDVQASQADEVSGELLVMNDMNHLYMAVSMALDHAKLHPDWWTGLVYTAFTDEGDPLDGQWDAPDCGPPLPGEGLVKVYEKGPGIGSIELEAFFPFSQLSHCAGAPYGDPLVGVQREAEPGTPMVFEQAFNLTSSELDKVGPGDCFRLGLRFYAYGCEWGSGCLDQGNWLAGSAQWPGLYDNTPPTFGVVCLDPCEVEFVPEPGTIALLGSGLICLAGYATLRWRTRE
jgi:hypothetical protein